jgi:NitT/TauT family transport system substrate-binding protein
MSCKIGIWALVLAAVLPIGCKRGGDQRKEVRIGYFANVTHAQAVLGVESGEFQQAVGSLGLTLKTKVFNAGPSLISDLLAGSIDIGYVGPGPAINAHAGGPEQIRVVAGAAANGVLIVVRKELKDRIKSPADLRGYSVATPQAGNTQDISARHFFKAVLGESTAKIKPISNAQQLAEMITGGIDAAWVPEPWGSRLKYEAGAEVIGRENQIKELWPEGKLSLTVVVTTPKYLAEHADVVEKILGVHHSWTARLQAEPQKYAGQLGEALYKLSNARLKNEVLADSLKNVEFTDEPLEKTLQRMAEWSDELRPPGAATKVNGLVDLTIMAKLAGSPRRHGDTEEMQKDE